MMSKATTSLFACLCLVLLVAGCGGGSDTGGGSASPAGESNSGQESAGGGQSGSAEKTGQGSGGSNTGSGSGLGPSNPSKKEVEDFKAPPGGDDSVQTYGGEAGESKAEEIVTAMRSFLRTVAVADYAKICDGLTSEAIKQDKDLLPTTATCPATLKTLMAPREGVEAEILRAARGVVYQVRIEDGTAFVLFTPEGGQPSFFVMKREGGRWKATGVAPGAPLNPES